MDISHRRQRCTFVGLLLIASVASTGCYTLRQALHYNNLVNGRVAIQSVLKDDRYDQDLRSKLAWVPRILAYASAVGLDADHTYQGYVDHPGSAVSYLVQAAHNDRLEWVTWWFPGVGSVPYLGFFDPEERDSKARELRAVGYDVTVGNVGAFSTLGWTEDLIFKSMLGRNLRDLVHLLLHEIAHRTLWVPGEVRFNENLAEWVAESLTDPFLKQQSLADEQRLYLSEREDRKLYQDWLSSLHDTLQTLYSNQGSLDSEALLARKAQVFDSAKAQAASLPWQTPKFSWIERREWNNAAVLGESLYGMEIPRFDQASARCGPKTTPREFLDLLRSELRTPGDPWVALDRMCKLPA